MRSRTRTWSWSDDIIRFQLPYVFLILNVSDWPKGALQWLGLLFYFFFNFFSGLLFQRTVSLEVLLDPRNLALLQLCKHGVHMQCNVSSSPSFEFCNSDINQIIVTTWDFQIFPDSSIWNDAWNDKTHSKVEECKSGFLLPITHAQVKVILGVMSICILWCERWEICDLSTD